LMLKQPVTPAGLPGHTSMLEPRTSWRMTWCHSSICEKDPKSTKKAVSDCWTCRSSVLLHCWAPDQMWTLDMDCFPSPGHQEAAFSHAHLHRPCRCCHLLLWIIIKFHYILLNLMTFHFIQLHPHEIPLNPTKPSWNSIKSSWTSIKSHFHELPLNPTTHEIPLHPTKPSWNSIKSN
jgi:hypothetical protein